MTSPALPGTKPSRPVYPPPVPTGQLPDAGGRTAAEHAHRTQQAVADLYTRWRAAHSRDIDPNYLKDNAGAFSVSDAALQLPDVLDAVRQDSDDANRKVNDLITSQRVGDDVASQIAAQRYWSRAQRTLDAQRDGAKAVAAARDLVDSASDNQVPVLAEELSSYLASRSLPTDWLSGALANKIPGLAEARADAIVKARQLALVHHNHRALSDAIAKDTAAPKLLNPNDVTAEPYRDGN